MTNPRHPEEPTVRLAIIIGSTREGRFGPTIATWLVDQAHEFGEFDVDVIDLADTALPHTMARFGATPDGAVAALGARLTAAEAFAVVTPEYNHSLPASLKNAIDHHLEEWTAKPVALVSYGGMASGLRAAEHLRLVFAELHAVTVSATPSASTMRTASSTPAGRPTPPVAPLRRETSSVSSCGGRGCCARPA